MRIQLIANLTAAAIVAGAMIPPAAAQPVIDDFETGTFHLTAPAGSFVTGFSSVSSPAHALTAFREVRLASNELPAKGDLEAWTIVDDKVRFTFGPGGGSVSLIYNPPSPVDLTDAGQNDRIEVAISPSTVGGYVHLWLYDQTGGIDAHTLPTSAGAHVFPFLAMTGVDPTQVSYMFVQIENPEVSAYDVRDIRAMRTNATPLRFDVPTETVVGPPFPVDPLIFTVTDQMPSDLQKITLLNATKIASGAAAGVALTGMDSGGDTEPGFVGAVSTSWNEPGRPFESTAFELQVDISALSGVQPQPFLPALPVITTTPTGFLLEFDVHFPSDEGPVVRTSRRHMPFDTLPGQALQFENVRVHPPDPGMASRRAEPVADPLPAVYAAGTTTGFRVTFDAVLAGDVDPGAPLFETTFTGDCRPEAATGVAGLDAPIGDQALHAQPTVTRTGTHLLLAQPAAFAGRIDLFDVTGRFLRRLEVAPGSRESFWDGGDSGGQPAAAGVYFARFADGRRDHVARIVLVR